MKGVINHQVWKLAKTFSVKSDRKLGYSRKEVIFLLYAFDERREGNYLQNSISWDRFQISTASSLAHLSRSLKYKIVRSLRPISFSFLFTFWMASEAPTGLRQWTLTNHTFFVRFTAHFLDKCGCPPNLISKTPLFPAIIIIRALCIKEIETKNSLTTSFEPYNPCHDCPRNYISVIFKADSGKKAYHRDFSICFSLLLPFMSGRAIQAQPSVKPPRSSASSSFCLVGRILFLFLTNRSSTEENEEKEIMEYGATENKGYTHVLSLSHVHVIVYWLYIIHLNSFGTRSYGLVFWYRNICTSIILLNNSFSKARAFPIHLSYRDIRVSVMLLILSLVKDTSSSFCRKNHDGPGVCISLPAGPNKRRRNQTCLRV